MNGRHVVVTLTPVYAPDTLPFRSLTFASNEDTAPLGRASKSETKNLVPAHDNGWFDSRVMSREHAVLTVSLEKETVYIRDHGSMHGTLVNDRKIPARENVSVNNGDILTFGSEVSRGPQTFRPITVRFDCKWHDPKQTYPTPIETAKAPTNTFTVPDDDDDDDMVEVVEESNEPSSDSSDVDYGSDVSRPLDLTSPVTSPEAKHSELPNAKPAEPHAAPGSQRDPVVLDQDPQPSRSSPLAGYSRGVHQSDETESQPDADNISEEVWLINKSIQDEHYDSAVDEDEMSSQSEEDAIEVEEDEVFLRPLSQKAMSPAPEKNLQSSPVPNYTVTDPVKKVAESQAQSSKEPVPSGTMFSSAPPVLTPAIQAPVPHPAEPPRFFNESMIFQNMWSDYHAPRVPSPSDKAMAKSTGAYLPNHNSFADCSMEVWPDLQGTSGPSGSAYSELCANWRTSNSANDSFPFGPHRSSGYLRHFSSQNNRPVQPPSAFDSTDQQELLLNKSKPENANDIEKSPEPAPTRVSISDILDKASVEVQPSIRYKSLKRKAEEFEADVGQSKETENKPDPNTQDSLPDAQPRPELRDLIIEPKDLGVHNPVKQTSCLRHPRKRVKRQQPRSIMKYATAAVIGAVVGGIGTIAALASLPPDFFD